MQPLLMSATTMSISASSPRSRLLAPSTLAVAASALLGGFAASVATAGEATPANAHAMLVAAQEIQTAWVGKTVAAALPAAWWQASGKPFDIQLKADGSALLSGAAVDTGIWHLSGTGFCTTWKTIRAGEERCFTVLRDGKSTKILNPDGTVNATVTAIR